MPSRKYSKIKSVWNLNGTHQLLVCAGDVNLLEDSIDAIRENAETLLQAIGDIGLEINAEKTSV
jgi:histidinol-phosphate/aromatic aminotransferase/cobyric acid decarboxylase-like protein